MDDRATDGGTGDMIYRLAATGVVLVVGILKDDVGLPVDAEDTGTSEIVGRNGDGEDEYVVDVDGGR